MSTGSNADRTRERLLASLTKAPAAVAVLAGPDLVYEYANDLYRALVTTVREGEPFGSQTEQGARFRALAMRAWNSGDCITVSGISVADLTTAGRVGYFDLILQPTRAPSGEVDGVLLLAVEVTRLVEARRSLESEMERTRRAEQELRATLEARIRAEEERERLQARVMAAQRLEGLEKLAGGVAHDFNNLLMVISGNASLALQDCGPLHPATPMLEDVINAAQRAAHLTRQLLAYAGRGRFELRPMSLSEHVRGIGRLIEAGLPAGATLRLDLADGLPRVQGDPAQLHQLLLSLVTNGAEALQGKPGEVTVTLALEQVGADGGGGELVGAESLPPGPYLRLTVADAGTGMSKATRAKIFDPFFSTKAPGRGLGLAAAMGIVRAHHGALRIDSETDRGTRVEVLLPAAENVAGSAAVAPAQGTVLVIDDERLVRATTARVVASLGYEVIEAGGGEEALALVRDRRRGVAAVLLDLTMPGLSGEQTLRELRKQEPGLPVVVCSGYAPIEVAERLGQQHAAILPKPFTVRELSQALRTALASKANH